MERNSQKMRMVGHSNCHGGGEVELFTDINGVHLCGKAAQSQICGIVSKRVHFTMEQSVDSKRSNF